MYIEGREADPLPSETALLYDFFFVKLRDYLKRWGGHPNTFSVFGFKSLFRKRWGGGFHTLILQGHGSLMLMEFSWGILRNSMTFLRSLPLKSKFAKT